MNPKQRIVRMALEAVAVAMSIASLVLGYIGTVDTGTQVYLLSIGLFALSVATLQKRQDIK